MATQQQLTEARDALHALMTGKAVVSVTFNGRTVQYSKAEISALESYIARLERELAGAKPRRNRITYVVPC